MESWQMLSRYFSDLGHIGNRIFELQSHYYQAGRVQSHDPFKMTPFDLQQIEFNIPTEPHERLTDMLTGMGEQVMLSEGVEYVKARDEYKVEDAEPIEVDKLYTIEAIDICYNIELNKKVKDTNLPTDLVEISYAIKNELKFPDDFFNYFPSNPMETPEFNSPTTCNKYGLVQGQKAYYSFYIVTKGFVVPVLSYPARIKLDQGIKMEGILMTLSDKFNKFSKSQDFNNYLVFRMIKNIRNKLLAKRGNPASLSLFTEKELAWCKESGLFEEEEGKLKFAEGENMTSFNDIMNKQSSKIDDLVKKWKETRLF